MQIQCQKCIILRNGNISIFIKKNHDMFCARIYAWAFILIFTRHFYLPAQAFTSCTPTQCHVCNKAIKRCRDLRNTELSVLSL